MKMALYSPMMSMKMPVEDVENEVRVESNLPNHMLLENVGEKCQLLFVFHRSEGYY